MTKFLAVDVKNGLRAAGRNTGGFGKPVIDAVGPKPTLPGQRDAAVQLPQSGHSSVLTL